MKIETKKFNKEGIDEHYFNVFFEKKNDLKKELKEMTVTLKKLSDDNDLKLISIRAFGTEKALSLLEDVLDFKDSILKTFLIVPENKDGGLSFAEFYAVKGNLNVRNIFFEEKLVGKAIPFENKQLIFLSDISAPGIKEYSHAATLIFNKMDAILKSVGGSISCVARTWFFLEDILDWYDTFNKVRNNYFLENKIIGENVKMKMPASTGIGVKPYNNSVCTLDIVAIIDNYSDNVIQYLTQSDKQNSASEYGSSFSRATNLMFPTKTLYVSGTASIDKAGKTIHVDDPKSQIEATIENVKMIISEAGYSIDNISRSIAYCKTPEIEKEFLQQNFKEWSTSTVIADVCRDNLLFEMEVTVVGE